MTTKTTMISEHTPEQFGGMLKELLQGILQERATNEVSTTEMPIARLHVGGISLDEWRKRKPVLYHRIVAKQKEIMETLNMVSEKEGRQTL